MKEEIIIFLYTEISVLYCGFSYSRGEPLVHSVYLVSQRLTTIEFKQLSHSSSITQSYILTPEKCIFGF